jgi:hypothetical protein
MKLQGKVRDAMDAVDRGPDSLLFAWTLLPQCWTSFLNVLTPRLNGMSRRCWIVKVDGQVLTTGHDTIVIFVRGFNGESTLRTDPLLND